VCTRCVCAHVRVCVYVCGAKSHGHWLAQIHCHANARQLMHLNAGLGVKWEGRGQSGQQGEREGAVRAWEGGKEGVGCGRAGGGRSGGVPCTHLDDRRVGARGARRVDVVALRRAGVTTSTGAAANPLALGRGAGARQVPRQTPTRVAGRWSWARTTWAQALRLD
jgi:hypothetical protein